MVFLCLRPYPPQTVPTGHWVNDAVFALHLLLQFQCAKQMVELCQDRSSKIQVAAWYFLEL